jgi:ubiquinone/menaquinone biosynthesis C-methylase UbiE
MAAWTEKRRHIRYYDRIAPAYNGLYQEEQRRKMAAALGQVQLPPRGFILDLGCGTGLLASSKIREQARTVVGLDASRGMLSLVDATVKSSRNVHFVLADADHAPFRHECFDAVFAITLLQNMPNPPETLREIRRLAKHDAAIIVTGLKKCFSPDSFIQLLADAKLEAKLLDADAGVKCHIASCSRRRQHDPS